VEIVIGHDHPSLAGHFPGRPVVPGVVVLDRVVAALEQAHGPLPPLRLPQVKFLQPLLPGEAARIEFAPASVASSVPGERRWRFHVLRGHATIASGEIVAGPVESDA